MKFSFSLVVAAVSVIFVSSVGEVQASELPIAQYRNVVAIARSDQEFVTEVREIAAAVEYWADLLQRAVEKKALHRSFVERKSSEALAGTDSDGAATEQSAVKSTEETQHDQVVSQVAETVAENAQVATPAVSHEDRCVEEAMGYLHQILDPHGIAVPEVEFDPSLPSKAVFNFSAIVISDCVSKSVLAHEAGHYVHSLATSGWAAMATDSELFCLGLSAETGRCEDGWLSDAGKTSEAAAAPGVEHAAHCIGSVLGDRGTFTQCPHGDLERLALERVQNARVG